LLILSRSVKKHGLHRPFLFLIGWFLEESSPLKPPGQMNRNLVESILGRSSIKIANLVPIQAIFTRGPAIDDSYQVSVHLAKQFQRRFFLEIDQSETRIVCGRHVKSPLKPNSQMNRNLEGSTYGRFRIKFAQNRMKGERHRLSPLSF
jgi:hypothetical protein